MFVPSDGIYHAALAQDPGLIEYGVSQQVLLATPTTLIGLLRAVHYGWRQEQIADSAREIAESARELHTRLARFVTPFAKAGRQLGSAVAAYNEAVGSFDSRVMPQVRQVSSRPARRPSASWTLRSRSRSRRGRSPRRPSWRIGCRASSCRTRPKASPTCGASGRGGSSPASDGQQAERARDRAPSRGSSFTAKNSRSKRERQTAVSTAAGLVTLAGRRGLRRPASRRTRQPRTGRRSPSAPSRTSPPAAAAVRPRAGRR